MGMRAPSLWRWLLAVLGASGVAAGVAVWVWGAGGAEPSGAGMPRTSVVGPMVAVVPASATRGQATVVSATRNALPAPPAAVLTFNPCPDGTLVEAPPSAATVAQAVAGLNAAPSAEAQALGLWLPFLVEAERDAAPMPPRLADCRDADCLERPDSEQQRATAEAHAAGAHALARRAVDTGSPGVYAMALQACGEQAGKAAPGACQLLSPARWAELDPTNAAPWFHVAGEARARGDAGAVREALYRASLAERNRLYGDELLLYAVPALAALDEPERSRLAKTLAMVTGAWSLPAFEEVTSACSEVAVRDANQRQLCDGVATVMVDRSRTMLEFMVGRRVAMRLDWPDDRQQALTRVVGAWRRWTETLAANEASVAGPAGPAGSASSAAPASAPTMAAQCAAAGRLLHGMQAVARLGEAGVARAAASVSVPGAGSGAGSGAGPDVGTGVGTGSGRGPRPDAGRGADRTIDPNRVPAR